MSSGPSIWIRTLDIPLLSLSFFLFLSCSTSVYISQLHAVFFNAVLYKIWLLRTLQRKRHVLRVIFILYFWWNFPTFVMLHPSVQNAKSGFYFSITLSVKLLLSVAYSPSVTWLFLFNSFVGQAYKWERVPCPLILFLWADKLVLLVYIYNAKAFFFASRKQRKRYTVTGRKILF